MQTVRQGMQIGPKLADIIPELMQAKGRIRIAVMMSDVLSQIFQIDRDHGQPLIVVIVDFPRDPAPFFLLHFDQSSG